MIRKTILPGDPGTKQLTEKYGKDLVCVRYRYDAVKRMRYKTAEVVLDRKPWKPDSGRVPGNKMIKIRIGKFETTLQALVESYGGKRTGEYNIWRVSFKAIKELGLEKRIIKDKREYNKPGYEKLKKQMLK